MWWLSGPDKPSRVSEAHPVHLLAPAHQGLQDQIRLSGSYKKRQHCEDKHGSDGGNPSRSWETLMPGFPVDPTTELHEPRSSHGFVSFVL